MKKHFYPLALSVTLITTGILSSSFSRGQGLGIGQSTPTAILHLKAGTGAANTAPLKLAAGTNLTTPEAGAIEFDGTRLYYTTSTPTRITMLGNNIGIAGGTTLVGGTASGDDITLSSTSNATKGHINFGNSAYDESNNRLGIGTANPASPLHVVGTAQFGTASSSNGTLQFNNSTNGNTVTLTSGATSASYSMTLPTAQGAANSLLVNNGSGVLSWNNPGVEVTEVSATASTNITGASGTTYSVMNSMTINAPETGTYLVMFSANASAGANNTLGTFALHVDGTIETSSTRNVSFTSNGVNMPLQISELVSATAGQAINVRWRIGANAQSCSVTGRSLVIMKVF